MQNCRIITADCLEATRQIKQRSVDFSLFSPPYDSIRDYKKGWTFDYRGLGGNLYEITKDGGGCAVVIGDGTKNFAKSLTTFNLAVDWCENSGWKLFETCIYQRDGNPGAWWTSRFRVDHEFILIFFKGERPKTFRKEHLLVATKHAGKIYSGTDRLTNGGVKKIQPKVVNPMKCRGTVWHYRTSNTEGNRLKLEHPATFPDKLAEDLILCFSEPGDLVLDPMCGSGTSCVQAIKNQRRTIGIDINPDYCKIAEARVEAETRQQKIPLESMGAI